MTDNWLFSQAASRLAKQKVKAFVRVPIVKGAAGTCYVDHHGQLTIEIIPGRDDYETLGHFLHEALHARFGHVTEPHTREIKPGEIDVKTVMGPGDYKLLPHEVEVREQIGFWERVADKYAENYTGTWLEQRLKGLWLRGAPEPKNPAFDRDEIIKNAAKYAVDCVMTDWKAEQAAKLALEKDKVEAQRFELWKDRINKQVKAWYGDK